MNLSTLVPPSPPLTGLDVLVSAGGPATVVGLRGESDMATVPAIVDALAGVIADREGSVIVDLAQTAFITPLPCERCCGHGRSSTAASAS